MKKPAGGSQNPSKSLYNSTNRHPEKAFEDLAILAVRSMDTPCAIITLHDDEGSFIKTSIGADVKDVSEILIIESHIAENVHDILVVEDARKDSRFKDIDFITGAPHFVFCAGAALTDADGSVVGTLVVMDQKPRKLTDSQIEAIKLISGQVIQLLKLGKAEAEIRNSTFSLTERVKETTCLQRIANLVNSNTGIDEILSQAIDFIPAGWQYPEQTMAAISWGRREYKTADYKKTNDYLSASRKTADDQLLTVTVAYREKMDEADLGPFLEEENRLLNSIADNLVLSINQATIHQRNAVILGSTVEGIYGIDEKGACTFINNAAAKMLGYTPDECLGQNMHKLIHHHTESGHPYPEADCPIYQTRKNKEGCRVNNEVFWTRQKKAIPVRFSSTPILTDGKFTGAVIVFNDISETKKAEDKLQLREKRYRALVENSADAIAILSHDGSASYVSPAITQVLGYSEAEALKLNLFEIIHPDDQAGVMARMKDVLENPGVPIQGYTARTKHKDGSWRWLEATNTNLLHDSAINGIIDNFRDVTERVEFEQSLKASEERYRQLFDASPLPKWIYDLESGGILDVNQTALENYGYSRDEFLSLHITDLRPESEYPALKKVVKSAKNLEGTKRFGVFTHLKKNGELMRMDVSGHRLRYNGKDSLLVVCNNVTEREAAFDALQASEARYRGFYESQTNYVLRTDMEGNYTYVNKKFTADFGWIYPDGEFIGKNSLTSILERDHEKVGKVVESCVASPGSVFKVEIDKPAPDGGYVTTLWEFVCILNERGMPVEIQCVGLNITDRVNTERALIESYERFEKVTQATNDAIWDFDVVKNELFWGQGFHSLFGYDLLATTPTFELLLTKIHDEDRDRVATKVANYMKDDSASNWHEEYRFLKADGTYAHVIDRAVFIRNKRGKVTRVVGAMTDITYRKEHEESLKELNEQLEKHAKDLERSNAELEQFAYIASHDLQEPLRMVTSFLNQLENKYNEQLDDKAQQYIYFAVDGARRMRQIILDLLEFSRVGRLEEKQTTIDLNEIMDGYCILRKKAIEEKSAVIRYGRLPEITTYKTPVTQVFHNLIDNAIKYARPGVPPKVEIKATDRRNHWEFEVRDNGIGIEEEYFEKIFVIFQRLHDKSEYSGTGMGLAIVRKIIENLGGKIWLVSKPGKGSSFHFTLPKQSRH